MRAPHPSMSLNLMLCQGVTESSLVCDGGGTVTVTVHGGNPVTVAGMILSCLPPGTKTGGDTLVDVNGVMVRLHHVNPTLEHPEDFVAPLPLRIPEGHHEPTGGKPVTGGTTFYPNGAPGPRALSKFQFTTVELVALMVLVALVVSALLTVWD